MKQKKVKTNSSQLENLLIDSFSKRKKLINTRDTKMCVIYTRVSTSEQMQTNGSLDSQKRYCDEYASRNGYIIKEYFGGTFESAKNDERKEFTRMINYVKKEKDVSTILFFSYDRFSRSGANASYLAQQLRKLNIFIKSVTQDVDNKTANSKLQEDLFFLMSNFDNEMRKQKTITGTLEVLRKGYWPYHTPMGYKNINKKERAVNHIYQITEEGQYLRKAFEWKAKGCFTNKEIIEKLKAFGVRLTEKNFTWILSNVFYAGYVTGTMLNGELVKGNHPPLVSIELFLKANNILKTSPNVGIPKKHKQEELPLKLFTKDQGSNSPLTGYSKKGNWYYKSAFTGIPMNVNARYLNSKFEDFLKQFEYNKNYKEAIKKTIGHGIRIKLSDVIDSGIQLKKQLTENKNMLEKVDERFAIGEIDRELYVKISHKYATEIKNIETQLAKNNFNISNLEKIIEKGVEIAANISAMWASANFNVKEKFRI